MLVMFVDLLKVGGRNPAWLRPLLAPPPPGPQRPRLRTERQRPHNARTHRLASVRCACAVNPRSPTSPGARPPYPRWSFRSRLTWLLGIFPDKEFSRSPGDRERPRMPAGPYPGSPKETGGRHDTRRLLARACFRVTSALQSRFRALEAPADFWEM